jgi:cell division protein FtsX
MTGAQFHYIARRVGSSLVDLRWSHMLTAGTMAMTLFVFGAFMVLQSNLETLLNGWGEQIQINAYLDKDISRDASQVLAQRLQTYPEVQRTRLISQEQAWKEFRSALGSQAGILDGLPPDVLPASVEIAVKAEFRALGLAGQVRQSLVNVVAALAAAGGRPDQITRMTWYITDQQAYAAERKDIGAHYREIIGRHFPAMTMVVVKALIEPEALVEIEATAVVE